MVTYKKTEGVKLKIMETASGLFNEHGYDNVKVIDIANEAGVAKGLIFYHFNSKDDLLATIIMEQTIAMFNAFTSQLSDMRPDIALHQLFCSHLDNHPK